MTITSLVIPASSSFRLTRASGVEAGVYRHERTRFRNFSQGVGGGSPFLRDINRRVRVLTQQVVTPSGSPTGLVQNVVVKTPKRLLIEAIQAYSTDHTKVKELIFSFFLTISEEDLNDNIVVGKAFFFSKPIYKALKNENHSLTLNQLKSAFRFFWSIRDSLTKDQVLDLATIAERIFILDSGHVSRFIHAFIKEEKNDDKLPFALSRLLHCLELNTLSLIDEQFNKMMATEGESQKKALEFFNISRFQKNILTWRYCYDRKFHNLNVISKGTQIGKDGSVNSMQAFDAFHRLNLNHPASVQFNSAKIYRSLSGGVCSAMTLRLLKLFVEERHKYASASETLKRVGGAVLTATRELRSVQAAYNSIEITGEVSKDLKRDKIEALLHYDNPNLTIIQASKEVDLTSSNAETMLAAKERMLSVFKELPDGIFVVRALCLCDPTDVEDEKSKMKGEQYGHSTLLIKEAGEHFYYDPTLGVMQLTHPEQLDMILQWENARWSLPFVRFYQVGPKPSVLG